MVFMHELGKPYTLCLHVTDTTGMPVTDDIVRVKIQDISTNKYFNGMFWIEQESELIVPHDNNGTYKVTFNPDFCSAFKLNIYSEKHNAADTQLLQVYSGGIIPDGVTPVKIGSSNFKSQDGTDTTILDIHEKPLVGVKISCFNKETKEIVAVSQTNDLGEWEMIIPEGYYFFMFEKEGYLSVSFERTVTSTCLL